MGCCESVHQKQLKIDSKLLFDKKTESEFSAYLSYIVSEPSVSLQGNPVDSEIRIGNELCVPLAYTLLHNLPSKFKLLHETFGASFEVMEEGFRKKNQSGMQLICERGYKGLLEYYLPHYMSLSRSSEYEEYTLEFTRSPDHQTSKLTPIQGACLHKQYGIMSYLFSYFKNPPHEFDLNFQDEATGDCCVLIAARETDVHMLEFLHDNGADFTVINKRGESALQVAAVWTKKKPESNYLPALRFLVEVAKVNVAYNFEEILLVLKNPALVKYIENALSLQGINETKADIEKREAINHAPRNWATPSQIEQIHCARFSKQDMSKDVDFSITSSIEPSSKNGTPFSSILLLYEDEQANN